MNPYESPKSSPTSESPTVLKAKYWLTWPARFAFGLVAMIFLNVARLQFTWRAYGTDGMEQIGFPFTFYEHGGFSYHQNWYYDKLAIDVAIAFAGAFWVAHLLRGGLTFSIRNIRRLGLRHLYEDEKLPP